MAETEWILDTPDGFKIYGLLNTSDKKNKRVILYIPGLGGDCMDYAAVRMATTFPEKGYDVVRINLYWWNDKARNLSDCTIGQHARDIDLIFKYFKKKYLAVFAAGHSYGGPSLMTSKINQFDAVSLWDPSFIPQLSAPQSEFTKAGKYYIALNFLNIPVVVSKMFIDEASAFDRDHAIRLAKKCKTPLQVIYADKDSFWIGQGESFHTYSKGAVDEHSIKQSNHYFYEQGSTEPLLRYTKKWFDQF